MQALAGIIVLMIAVVIWRGIQGSQSAEERLGVKIVSLSPAGGSLLLRFSQAPDIGIDGGAVAVRSGGGEFFVVRLSENSYRAYASRSSKGQPVRYDSAREVFMAGKRATVAFDPDTGRPLNVDVKDELTSLIVRVTGDGIEITRP